MAEHRTPARRPPETPGAARAKEMHRVTLTGAAVNLILTVAQIAGGIWTQSQAVVADGLHTLSDLLSDGVVLFATRQSNRTADEAHPYGHGRIETLATVIVGLILVGVGLGIGSDAAERLFEPERLFSPEPLALFFAALAIVSKESLYHYTMRVSRRVRSQMLEANAWHHRSDVLSSIVVLAGVGGTLAGLPYLDAVAAVAVAAMIAGMGGRMIWNSFRELIDTGLEQVTLVRIRETISAVGGVRGLHLLRTRRMGGAALADVHIQVDPRISVSEGHQISETVRRNLIRDIDELVDVTVHIDPEDDLNAPANLELPGRAALLRQLATAWADVPITGSIDRIEIHYLKGRVDLDLFLPLSALAGGQDAEQTAALLKSASRRLEVVGEVGVFFH